MKYKVCEDYIFARLEIGDEIITSISQIANDLDICCGIISGIGAVDVVLVGCYLLESKEYVRNEYLGDMEIVSLSGNITLKNDLPYIHCHISFSNEQNEVKGGHLDSAYVSATAEIAIKRISSVVNRYVDELTGLNLMDLEDDL